MHPPAREAEPARRTVVERWPIPEEARQQILGRLLKVINNDKATHREAIDATKVLLSSDKLNLEGTRMRLELEEFDAIWQKLESLADRANLGRNRTAGGGAGIPPRCRSPH